MVPTRLRPGFHPDGGWVGGFQEPENHPRNVQIRFVKPRNETCMTLIREMN